MSERLPADERRERIVQTAMAIIDEQGHQKLSMRALARACGLSAPGLMNYFADMDTLLTAVVAHRDARDEMLFGEWRLAPGIARRVLDGLVDNIIARPKAAALFAMVEAAAIDPRNPAHEHFRERAHKTTELFSPLLALEYSDADELANQLLHIMDGLQLAWLRDPTSFDLRARWDAMADAIFGAARPAPVSWEEASAGLPLDLTLAELLSQGYAKAAHQGKLNQLPNDANAS